MPNALVVPVTALLARSAGGYAIEVVGAGARNHLLPVSLGLFTVSKRPSFQSALACSMRSLCYDTKFHFM